MAGRTNTPDVAAGAATDYPAAAYGWYVTFVLLLGFTFSFVDRQVLNLLVEPIRADLDITDTQISFVQGLAFAITYVLASVPIGRLVDRFNRVRIMIVGVLVWSATTIACGLSRNYGQLLVARMGVGVGEATLSPAAWSVLADYFHPERLSRPISVYLMGPYIGAGIAMIAGAEVLDFTREVSTIDVPLLGELAPWQFTFIAVGLPGVLIAALLGTVREPIRTGRGGAMQVVPPWREVFAYMRRHARIYIALHLGVPFIVVMLYGLQAWTPTILVRVHGWDLADAGRNYGLIALVAGSAGVLSGPFVARLVDRAGRGDAALLVAILGAALATVCLAAIPLQGTATGALWCIAGASFSVTLPLALVTSAMQQVTPNAMRGVVNGAYVVTTNVIGLALGPTLVAACTDYVFRDPAAVDRSLAAVSLCMGPIAIALLASGLVALRRHASG
ncbi:MAG: MFS transporter [Pseudomonadales bacterium]|nr:MFS transporter [Pseudomonadales bacterium]MCP5185002.1 MFS transporter [Pseudomonadales bacterium]